MTKLSSTARPSTIRTFLIADIRGWTRFTRELGDEAASRLAAKFAQIVGEGVEAWGGRLLELRGDEAMCTFESARGALRCGVELQEAFADESAIAPELPLNVGIGLDAGEAVPVADGYRGTALNVAARLCATAQAGEVIATGSLVHLAGRVEGLTFADLDAKPMKGFDQPVPAVLVDSATPHEHDDPIGHSGSEVATPSLPPELDPVVPLVAREAELRWLSWHWRRARHGHGGVVGLTGLPGIGCTRLVAELAAMGHREGAVVAYLRGEEAPVPPDDASLVIVDDLERLAPRRARQLFRGLATGLDRRLLVAVEHIRDRGADAPAMERLIPSDRVHRLGPIDVDGVVQISRLYLDKPGTDVPAQLLLEESDGIPAEVHRVASQWARATASRKLRESARRTSRERRGLRAAEAAMIDDVERLETARERSRLFVPLAEAAIDEPSAAPQQVCPYKGLAAFDAADADYFFGRERLIAELVARMVGSSFIGLVGASGSGKSSTLQAGLLPSLAGGVIPGSDEWIQVPMRPGEHPMAELRASLTRHLADRPAAAADPASMIDAALAGMRPSQRLLVIVDQFEELFLVRDDAERAAFVDVLTMPRAGMKVLVSLRADHYERCAAYPRLARLIGAEQVLVGPLTGDELQSVIRHPAERVGLRVDAELVDALVADVSGEPGGLPLLSTALLELWETRNDGRMTLAAYRATGGVRGAVARLADGVYGRLEAAQQAVARTIFLRLAGEGEGGAIVRRRVRIEELDVADRPETADTLAALTSGRLVTATDGFVEVAHEALLREWPRLRRWIHDDSAGRQLRLHLMESARTWDEGGREEGDLYRGARLASVLDWSSDHAVELNAVEREFVETSQAASEREAERQRRANRRLRGLLAGTGAFLIIAMVAGIVAVLQATRADDEARFARARELWASSIAVLDRDPELTMLLAIEASREGIDPPTEALTALHSAVQRARTIFNTVLPASDERPVQPGVLIAPDGRTLFASSERGVILEYDVDRGELIRRFELDGARLPDYVGLAVSPDGESLGYVDRDGDVHLIDLVSGDRVVHDGPGYHGDTLVFSPDGGRLATISYDSEDPVAGGMTYVSVMEAATGTVEQTWSFPFMWSISFHPDGDDLLGTACPCNSEAAVFAMDIATGEVSIQVGAEESIVQTSPTAARFSPDGSMLATVGLDRRVHLWDTEDGASIATLAGHTAPATDIMFSSDGGLLATTGRDGIAKVWDIAREELILDLAGQTGFPALPSFSSDGRRLATVSTDLSVRVWDLSAVRSSEGHGVELGDAFLQIRDMDTSRDAVALLGRGCRVGFCPGTLAMASIGSDDIVIIPDQLGAAIAISSDGALAVSQAEEDVEPFGGPTRLYRSSDGGVEATLDHPCTMLDVPDCIANSGQVQAAAFSADGDLVAAAGFTMYGTDATVGWIGFWSVDGTLVHLLPDVVGNASFDPSADRAAVVTGAGVSILDTTSFQELATIPLTGAGSAEFSPDGRLLAVAASSNAVGIYETEGWTLVRQLFTVAAHLHFDSEGSRLLSSDVDGIARIWDVESGDLTQVVPVEKAGPGITENRVRFLNDDLVASIDSRTLLTITLEPESLLELARERVSRDFTDAECRRYLGWSSCAARPRD